MRRLPFVIWMIGWPPLHDFGELEDFLRNDVPPVDAQQAAFLLWMAIWAVVAILLWRDGSQAPAWNIKVRRE